MRCMGLAWKASLMDWFNLISWPESRLVLTDFAVGLQVVLESIADDFSIHLPMHDVINNRSVCKM